MCLAHAAHGVDGDHEIFQGPFPVELQWEEEQTPSNYRKYYSGKDLGPTMKTWRVQKTGYTTDDSASPGVVAGGWGFEDSPDAEVIAGGLNTKGPNAVALGRHGPLFHWGFYAEPRDMTPSGNAAFLNAVVYTAKFDRAPLLVRKKARHRGYLRDSAIRLASLEESHADLVRFYTEQAEKIRAAQKVRDSGERELTAEEEMVVDWPIREAESFEEYRDKAFSRAFPAALIAELGKDDPAAYIDYVEANIGYAIPAGGMYDGYAFDEDAKAFGFANDNLNLLRAAVNAIGVGGDLAEPGARILERYTDQSFETAAEWQAWYLEHRDRLFFSDVGGYRWYVGPATKTSK